MRVGVSVGSHAGYCYTIWKIHICREIIKFNLNIVIGHEKFIIVEKIVEFNYE